MSEIFLLEKEEWVSLIKIKEELVPLYYVYLHRCFEEGTGKYVSHSDYCRNEFPTADSVMHHILGLFDEIHDQIILPLAEDWNKAYEEMYDRFDRFDFDHYKENHFLELSKFIDSIFKDPFLFYIWQYNYLLTWMNVPLRTCQMNGLFLKILIEAEKDTTNNQSVIDELELDLFNSLMLARMNDKVFRVNIFQ